jgi:uncharacterized membrane protein (DUF2068 family)
MTFSLGKSVRAVAIFELAKGLMLLLAGFGALAFLHHDVRALAMELVGRFHLDPEQRYPSIFIRAASEVTDAKLWLWSGIAVAYAAFRFTEGYGLWHERPWAEWLALVSGGIYLPLECYELIQKVTWVRAAVLVANIGVVLLMLVALRRRKKSGPADETGSAE